MRFSDNGIRLLKQLEGCVKSDNKHVIYDDKTGNPINNLLPLPHGATIGYGHLVKPWEDFNDGITEAKATELLRKDILTAEHAVKNCISSLLTQNQYDALVLFAYNIGVQNFAHSTVVKYLNNPYFHSSKYATLESAWKAWNKSGGYEVAGLNNRRNQEWGLFNK